jgi:membrane protease YdiL (CAAX protease family)
MLSCVSGVLAGMAGVLIWVMATELFAGDGGEPWPLAAYYLRVASAALLAPLVEEQLIRGYVLRFVLQWQDAKAAGAEDPFHVAWAERSVFEIEPGRISAWSVAISTAVFAAGHGFSEIPAAILYGLLMCGLWHWRRDLLSCVVAHAATNLALAWYVRAYGEWSLW